MKGTMTLIFEPERETVAGRAYEIYARRGKKPDHELEDWLEAEEELRQEATSAIASWNPYFGYFAEILSLVEAWAEGEVRAADDDEESATVETMLTVAAG